MHTQPEKIYREGKGTKELMQIYESDKLGTKETQMYNASLV